MSNAACVKLCWPIELYWGKLFNNILRRSKVVLKCVLVWVPSHGMPLITIGSFNIIFSLKALLINCPTLF